MLTPAWLRSLGPWSAVASLLALALASADFAPHPPKASEPEDPIDRAPTVPDPAPFVRTSPVERTAAKPPAECPAGMQLVEGDYCPDVEQTCLRWMDPPNSRFANYRCAEYAPSRCLSPKKKHMRFCIERDEHVRAGETLPENQASLSHAARVCEAEGKRVCRESEWNFACEGEEMRPYPYGFRRDASACNADLTDLLDEESKLKDQRAPAGSHPRCTSPFGVRDLSGNLEEMVARDGPGPLRAAMKGAYWQPSRNNCRANQTSHDAYYHGTETGFRCCADVD